MRWMSEMRKGRESRHLRDCNRVSVCPIFTSRGYTYVGVCMDVCMCWIHLSPGLLLGVCWLACLCQQLHFRRWISGIAVCRLKCLQCCFIPCSDQPMRQPNISSTLSLHLLQRWPRCSINSHTLQNKLSQGAVVETPKHEHITPTNAHRRRMPIQLPERNTTCQHLVHNHPQRKHERLLCPSTSPTHHKLRGNPSLQLHRNLLCLFCFVFILSSTTSSLTKQDISNYNHPSVPQLPQSSLSADFHLLELNPFFLWVL